MKDKNRLLILQILTAAAVFSAVYSSVLLLRVALFSKSGGFFVFVCAFLFYAAGTAAGIMGSTGGWLADKISGSKIAGVLMLYKSHEEKKKSFSTVILCFSVIIPITITFFLYYKESLPRTCFETAAILLIYFLSLKCGLNDAYGVLTKTAATIGFVVFLAAYGVSAYYAPLEYLRNYIRIFSYIFLLSFLIVKNQEDIDSNIFSGKYVEKSVLPRNMRKFNTKAVILLFLAIIILLNSKVIAILLAQVGKGLLAALKLLFSLFDNGKPAEHMEMKPENGAGLGFPFMGGSNGAPEHPLIAYIRGVLSTTVLLYIAFKLLISFYRYIFKNLLPLIAGLLKRLFARGEKEVFETDGDYDDEVEIEKPVNKSSRRKARARVKKSRIELKGITDPVQRIRCMYAAVLELFQLAGVGIMGSDTVGNIYSKAVSVPDMSLLVEPLNVLSRKYEMVRYGNIVPESSELSVTEQSYKEITAFLLKKR